MQRSAVYSNSVVQNNPWFNTADNHDMMRCCAKNSLKFLTLNEIIEGFLTVMTMMKASTFIQKEEKKGVETV